MRLLGHIINFFTGRWYALYVSGHGLAFVRDGRLMGKAEALYEARRWYYRADTIGGGAQVKNELTGRIVYEK